jgi:hypothetical protein
MHASWPFGDELLPCEVAAAWPAMSTTGTQGLLDVSCKLSVAAAGARAVAGVTGKHAEAGVMADLCTSLGVLNDAGDAPHITTTKWVVLWASAQVSSWSCADHEGTMAPLVAPLLRAVGGIGDGPSPCSLMALRALAAAVRTWAPDLHTPGPSFWAAAAAKGLEVMHNWVLWGETSQDPKCAFLQHALEIVCTGLRLRTDCEPSLVTVVTSVLNVMCSSRAPTTFEAAVTPHAVLVSGFSPGVTAAAAEVLELALGADRHTGWTLGVRDVVETHRSLWRCPPLEVLHRRPMRALETARWNMFVHLLGTPGIQLLLRDK